MKDSDYPRLSWMTDAEVSYYSVRLQRVPQSRYLTLALPLPLLLFFLYHSHPLSLSLTLTSKQLIAQTLHHGS